MKKSNLEPMLESHLAGRGMCLGKRIYTISQNNRLYLADQIGRSIHRVETSTGNFDAMKAAMFQTNDQSSYALYFRKEAESPNGVKFDYRLRGNVATMTKREINAILESGDLLDGSYDYLTVSLPFTVPADDFNIEPHCSLRIEDGKMITGKEDYSYVKEGGFPEIAEIFEGIDTLNGMELEDLWEQFTGYLDQLLDLELPRP